MSHRFVLPVLLLLTGAAVASWAQSTEVLEKRTGRVRVLLAPGVLDVLAREFAGRGQEVEVPSSQAGSLKALREDASTVGALQTGRWDFVVLVGHPTFGKTLVLDGEIRVGGPSEFLHHGRLLLEEIRRSGARGVLLVPPARPGAPEVDQQTVEWAYHRLGREGGAALAPVGDAFARVRRRRPEMALFDPYGEEWSPAGAYLAAGVLEATITGRPPAGPAAKPEPGSELSADGQRLLNEEAWNAVRDLGRSGGYRDIPRPPFPAVPTLDRGEPVTLGKLQGTWRGPFRLYPWPATLELTVRREAGAPRVSGWVRFHGSRPGLGFEASDPAFEDHVLLFRNPADLADGRTTYRLVARGDRLTGVAELVTESGDVYAIGGLELERVQGDPATRRR